MLMILSTKHILSNKLSIKYLGNLRFLGMEIARSSKGIALYQRMYVLDLLSEIDTIAAKPSSTPMDYKNKLHSLSSSPLQDPTSYIRLKKLLYFAHSRPDINFVVSHLNQLNSCLTNQHQLAAVRILKYLKSSHALGLIFPTHNNTILKGFSDFVWGECLNTRKSVTRWCFFIVSSLVSWKSKNQTILFKS
ncbi:putative RNA-directed DNA polymerase [Lupinus albus]|uniref:Putative RNA-directed DNA polymerase n=1 Tax=Lupinus albus TaxID=3870 RepID=A0A6A4P929_LUPAL|nr:putative RNA-directed DNA polymerase [Lupinus albus]